MTNRTYPYTAWVLQPSFKTKTVQVVEKAHPYSTTYEQFDKSDTGRIFHTADLYPTKEAAIAAGWEKVKAEEALLAKRHDTLIKKRTALLKG